ncbi:MAG: hypothetical protein ACM3NT_07375 [Methylocystaceae bacterium]
MKISERKKTGLIAILLILIPTGIWDIYLGKTGYGIGIIIGTLGVLLVSWRNIKKIKDMEDKGIAVYDERIMQVAGLAAQGTIKFLALGLALFVGLGAVLGPITKVNPYNFAGYLLAIVLILYTGLFTYHNRRL